jgi:flagellar biogenesis protein FliO
MTALDVARVVGGLLVVIALVLISGRLARRHHGLRGSAGLRVVERIGLSREAHLAVVEVEGQKLLLGVTAHGVTRLAGLDGVAPPAEADGAAPDAPVDTLIDSAPAVAARLAAEREAEAELAAARQAAARAAAALDALPIIDDDEDDAVPTPAPSTRREWPPTLPRTVDLDEYPDLASALRAAGRTTSAPVDAPEPELAADPEPAGQPRSRAEARRLRSVARAESDAQAQTRAAARAEIEAARAEAEAEASRTAIAAHLAAARIAALQAAATAAPAEPATARPADGETRRIVGPSQRSASPSAPSGEAVKQASGSVLSPATWKQGIEALRELTVRRG